MSANETRTEPSEDTDHRQSNHEVDGRERQIGEGP